MTATAAAAGSTPAPKSLPARFIGILFSPTQTFQSVVQTPKWFGILALSAVLIALFTALPMTTPGGKQAWLDQQVEQRRAFGVQTDDTAYAQLEKAQPLLPYITAGAVIVFTPIMALIVAGILFAIFNAGLGGEATFKQVFAIHNHAGAVTTVMAVFTGAINYLRGAVTSITTLGGLLPMLPEKSFVANLLGVVDIFYVWYCVVLAMGMAVLYKRRTQPIAITLLSIYALIAIAVAAFKSRGA